MSGLGAFVESLRRRRTGLLRLFILVLVNLVVFAAVTYRLANKQERLASERERLAFELEQRSGRLAELEEASKRVEGNAQAVSEFWNEIVRPRVPGLTEAWDEIDRLARETSVVRGRTGYDRELLDVGLEQIRATMPVEGDYFDLVRFINRLERSDHFFLIEEVTLSQRETTDTSIRLDCSIAFYLRGSPAAEASGP